MQPFDHEDASLAPILSGAGKTKHIEPEVIEKNMVAEADAVKSTASTAYPILEVLFFTTVQKYSNYSVCRGQNR